MRVLAKIFPALIVGILGLGLIAALGTVHGFFIMLLWNYLFVGAGSILGAISFAPISWFQGWMLAFLLGIVFKDSSSSSN
jgi:hypothetical protein